MKYCNVQIHRGPPILLPLGLCSEAQVQGFVVFVNGGVWAKASYASHGITPFFFLGFHHKVKDNFEILVLVL